MADLFGQSPSSGLWAVVVVGVLVGLDNLQVGAALGLAGLDAGRRRLAALAFGLCETAMPLLGLALGRGAARLAGDFGEWLGILALGVCGAVILLAARRGEAACERERGVAVRGATLVLLPLSLSFDNLLAGFSFGTLGFPLLATALVIGALSGTLCALGLFGGHRTRGLVPEWAELAGGVFLLALCALRLAEVLEG